MKSLSFTEWYDLNESAIQIELAESGADRELDFDSEDEFARRYVKYLDANGEQLPELDDCECEW